MNLRQHKEWEDAVEKIRDGLREMDNLKDQMEEELKEAEDKIAGLEVQIEVLRNKEP